MFKCTNRKIQIFFLEIYMFIVMSCIQCSHNIVGVWFCGLIFIRMYQAYITRLLLGPYIFSYGSLHSNHQCKQNIAMSHGTKSAQPYDFDVIKHARWYQRKAKFNVHDICFNYNYIYKIIV